MGPDQEIEPELSCSGCGASIYREHLNRNLAGRWAGQLFCQTCLEERQKADPVLSGTENMGSSAQDDAGASYQRPLNPTGRGATRIRTFHAKLTDGAVHHLDQQINLWLDSHSEVEIKFAQSTVGVFEGKHTEPSLILTIFY